MKCVCGHSRVMHRKDDQPHRCKATKGAGRCPCDAWRPRAAVVKVRFDEKTKRAHNIRGYYADAEIEKWKAMAFEQDAQHALQMHQLRERVVNALAAFDENRRGDAMAILREIVRPLQPSNGINPHREPDQPGAA